MKDNFIGKMDLEWGSKGVEMWIKRLVLLSFLFCVLLSSVLYGLDFQEELALTLLLNRYRDNETALLDHQRILNMKIVGLEKNQQSSEQTIFSQKKTILKQKKIIADSKQRINNIESSSAKLELEVEQQVIDLSDMGESLTTLQTSYDGQKLVIKIMKYTIIALASISVGEAAYIAIDYWFGK